MGKCKTCEWWKETDSNPYYMPEGFRPCENHKIGRRWDEANDAKPDDVYIDPDDPYCGPTMCPGPEFGCVHHKEKLS